MKVRFFNGYHEEIEEFPDNFTEEQISEAFNVWIWNFTDIGWEPVEEKHGTDY